MKLSDYLDIYQLSRQNHASHEENRSLGLEHEGESALRQLLAWRDKYLYKIDTKRLSSTYCSYLRKVDLISGIIALIAGMGTAAALLGYSGSEPVNVIYFLFVAVAIPLFTMAVGVWSMVFSYKKHSTPVYLSPANWLGKILALFGRSFDAGESIELESSIFNWLVIKRAQMLSLLFSVGLLLSLFIIVSTRDIAFGWSTTLQITPEAFHSMLETIATPWKSLFPSAVPSLELVQQSQYFRLGGKIGGDMIQKAAMLGEWWKFLAAATLFYAVILRFVLWVLASFGLQSTLRKSVMRIDGVSMLLEQMNTPVVSTASDENEPWFERAKGSYARIVTKLEPKYQTIIGWSMNQEMISLINDYLGISAETVESAGGANTLQQDNAIATKAKGDILLYVKAWEPPTMDFVDFLTDLSSYTNKITVAPIGTAEEQYRANPKDVAVWGRKLAGVDGRNVWMFSPK